MSQRVVLLLVWALDVERLVNDKVIICLLCEVFPFVAWLAFATLTDNREYTRPGA
jgi:hypothetical protein